MTTAPDSTFRLARVEAFDQATPGAYRPVLARDADSTYWMARYVERAEHVARLLLVNNEALSDVGDLAAPLIQRHWQSVLEVTGCDAPPPSSSASLPQRIADYMTFSPDNPNSILNCLTRARENARGIREVISAEIWEHLNTLYWAIRAEESRTTYHEAPDQLYRQIMSGSMLFQGLADQTLMHGQRWQFTRLGKSFERASTTCRILRFKADMLRGAQSAADSPLWNIHWTAVLRSCGSIEAFRRLHLGELDLIDIAQFLILEPSFPRSVRYGVQQALDAISTIRATVRPREVDPTERILGRLDAQLEYAAPEDLLEQGLSSYLGRIVDLLNEAALAVQRSFFLR